MGPRLVEISPPSDEAKRLWVSLARLASEFGEEEEWTLVGGLMVQLHAYEHGSSSRPTRDIDVLANARKRPSAIEHIAQTLDRLGAIMATPPSTSPATGYAFDLDGETVEVLGPDGLPEDPHTLGTFRTIRVDGGSQALHRTEKISISVDGADPVVVRRPTLLGAVLLKARAVRRVRSRYAEHRQDMIRLLCLMDDPRRLADAEGLKATEKRWLRGVEQELAWEDPAVTRLFSREELDMARLAYGVLTS